MIQLHLLALDLNQRLLLSHVVCRRVTVRTASILVIFFALTFDVLICHLQSVRNQLLPEDGNKDLNKHDNILTADITTEDSSDINYTITQANNSINESTVPSEQ